MANKRNLKHAINAICEELLIESVAASLYGNERHEENADALVTSILKMQADFTCRVSHLEPGIQPKAYYKALREAFSAQAIELADQINNL